MPMNSGNISPEHFPCRTNRNGGPDRHVKFRYGTGTDPGFVEYADASLSHSPPGVRIPRRGSLGAASLDSYSLASETGMTNEAEEPCVPNGCAHVPLIPRFRACICALRARIGKVRFNPLVELRVGELMPCGKFPGLAGW